MHHSLSHRGHRYAHAPHTYQDQSILPCCWLEMQGSPFHCTGLVCYKAPKNLCIYSTVLLIHSLVGLGNVVMYIVGVEKISTYIFLHHYCIKVVALTWLTVALYVICLPLHIHYAWSRVTTNTKRIESPATILAVSILLMKTVKKIFVSDLLTLRKCQRAKNRSPITKTTMYVKTWDFCHLSVIFCPCHDVTTVGVSTSCYDITTVVKCVWKVFQAFTLSH